MPKKVFIAAALAVFMASPANSAEVKLPVESKAENPAKSAAISFFEHLNFARFALANKNYEIANDSLEAANSELEKLKSSTSEQKISKMQTNRLNYQTGKTDYHYYPVEAGPVPVKEIKTGPFWAENKGLAVTDAEVVNVVIDLNNPKISEHMASALSGLKNKNYSAAELHLTRLSNIVVKDDTAKSTPLVKARDNLMLADSFIVNKNFTAARFALKHANSALTEAEHEKSNSARMKRIAEMREEINDLDLRIKAQDPSALDKAGAKVKQWWQELKD